MNFEEELKDFKEFKKNYEFNQLEIVEDESGNLYCEGELLKDENGYIGESDKWINAGYSNHGALPKLLSNLFLYEFEFRGFKFNSLEGFFQGIKFKDKDIQKEVFKYSGISAVSIKGASNYDWRDTGVFYWQGEPIKRDSKEYDELVAELYVSAIQNYFYRNAIKNCKVPIIHAIGEKDKEKTVYTRYEFEEMLNCLRDYLKGIDN